jgi:hypothetical protein
MAETHDLLAPGQAIPDRTFHHVHRIIGCGLPDIHQRVHDLLIRPAMQRALEGPDRRDHRGMHVGQGGGTDPGGERGGVHRVVGMQHETGVEDLCLTRGRRRTPHLQQEVGGEPKLRLGRADLAPVPRGMVGGDKERLLGDEPGALRMFAPTALESLSGSSAPARETRLRIASIGDCLPATSGRHAVTSEPRARPAAISSA